MAAILSHPFRLGPGGTAATVEQSSAEADTEAIAVLILTRRGERPLVADFGLRDPAFAGVDPSELAGQIHRWGPPVRLTGVDVVPESAATARVSVTFV